VSERLEKEKAQQGHRVLQNELSGMNERIREMLGEVEVYQGAQEKMKHEHGALQEKLLKKDQRIRELVGEGEMFRRVEQKMQQELGVLQDTLSERDERIRELECEVELLLGANDKLKHKATQINAKITQLEADIYESALIFGAIMPRLILAWKIWPPQLLDVDEMVSNATPFLQRCTPAILTSQLLDVPLNGNQARLFGQNIDAGHDVTGLYSNLSMLVYYICQKPKFVPNFNTLGECG